MGIKMSEKNTKQDRQKKPIQILRERYGGVSEELKKLTRAQTRILKDVKESIKNTYRTIPEISKLTGLPSHEVLWHLMAMKKYGMVIEGEERDGYYQYALKEEEKKK
jgi:predicted transcriptional regulator